MRQSIYLAGMIVPVLIGFSYRIAAADRLSIGASEPKPSLAPNRTIYMNGIDISSARNQDLRNVQIKIDEYGNLFITAPHYQVTEEETFTPLSSYKHANSQIDHRPPQPQFEPEEPKSEPKTAPKLGGDSALAAPVAVPPPAKAPEGVLPPKPQDQPASAKAPR